MSGTAETQGYPGKECGKPGSKAGLLRVLCHFRRGDVVSRYSPGTKLMPHPVPVCVAMTTPVSTMLISVASYAASRAERR